MNIRPFLKLWFQAWLQRLPKSIKLRFWKQIKPLLPKEPTQHLDDAFDPLHTLLWLSEKDPFRWVDAMAGTAIWGGNGGGKTSGPGQALLRAFMRGGAGGLILCVKPDEYEMVRSYAEKEGRLGSLIRFAPEEKWRFNFMAYLLKSMVRGGGRSANIVKTFVAIQDSLDRGDDAGAKQEKYWKNVLSQLLLSAVDLCLLANPEESLSVQMIHEVITSAPVSRAQALDHEWQDTSLCCRLIDRAYLNDALTPRQKSGLALTAKFFTKEFPGLPDDTRGSAVSTFTTMADGFLRGDMAELFSTGLNVVPEMTLEGAIWVLDLPLKLFGQVGLAAQILVKHIWQEAVERRDVKANPRPVFIWADEGQNFVNEHDVQFQTTARSSRACTVYLSQTLNNFCNSSGGRKGRLQKPRRIFTLDLALY